MLGLGLQAPYVGAMSWPQNLCLVLTTLNSLASGLPLPRTCVREYFEYCSGERSDGSPAQMCEVKHSLVPTAKRKIRRTMEERWNHGIN